MKKLSFAVSFLNVFLFPALTHALGSGSTLAVVYGTATVCAIVAAETNQRIICYRAGGVSSSTVIPIQPNVSYNSVAGGRTSLCALRSRGQSLMCWDTSIPDFPFNSIYNNNTALLRSLSIGDENVCATATNSTPPVNCWRTDGNNRNNSGESPNIDLAMGKVTSGFGFSCGIVPSQNNRVTCWGNSVGEEIERQFGNMSMENIEAGASHVCGVNSAGELVCRGNNSAGQLDVPLNSGLNFASGLALGDGFSCGIRRLIGTVVCWGSMNESAVEGIEYESIAAGLNFTCGLTTRNFSVLCWGHGWPRNLGSNSNSSIDELPLRAEILPGPCIDSPCNECGLYPQSTRLCSGSGNICRPSPCFNFTSPSPPPPLEVPRRSRELSRGLLAFAIVGSVGGFMGICTIVYCLWTGVCLGKKKVHNSVQPTVTRGGWNGCPGSNNGPPSRSLTIRRQGSRSMRRQRSGASSKHADTAEEFSLAELAAATNNFSLENKIGAGSFGIVYRGKLLDGHEVAIKRGDTGQKTKKAIFKNEENGGNPMSLVDFAVPAIMANELAKVLDIRVGPPETNEAEALELMAYTAMHCVNMEGKERPTISDIVCNLERAVTVCNGSHGSISNGGFVFSLK
ncbi:hypothetical protein GQ457_09G030740 [Hibiscus cannabinus]